MSKRKKVLIECPDCGAHLFVKRSLYKVSSHPLYEKKNQLIINYSKSVFTESRTSKLWLRCLNCTFSKEFKDETALKEDVIHKIGGQLVQHAAQMKSKNREVLPTIIRPSKLLYDAASNKIHIPDLNQADAVT